MEDEKTLTGEACAEFLMRKLNCCGASADAEVEAFIDRVMNCHRTLRQMFFGRVVFALVKRMARSDYWADGRDEVAKKACDVCVDALIREYELERWFPGKTRDELMEHINFPCI